MFTELVVFSTDLGWTGILTSEGLIQRTWIGHENRSSLLCRAGTNHAVVPVKRHSRMVGALQKYCSGKRTALDSLKIDESWMTPFQKQVTRACRSIGWGQVLTYGQLAKIAGSPRASRAVGSVMANNRYPLIVPCHRVCSSTGIGGFSAPNGVALKQRLLANEGRSVADAISH
ncbi:MAG: MGMT family protein [Pirellulaceae bacterium]|nr:MGMT family protein [Pirellulaceae bacterium]